MLSLGWPSSHQHSHLPVTARRGSLQLWQFLIALLEDPANCGAITWTGRGMEFKLIEPEEVSLEIENSRYGIMQRLSYLTKLEEEVGAHTMFNLRNSPKNKNIDRKMKNLQSDVCERIFIFIFLLMKILQFSWS